MNAAIGNRTDTKIVVVHMSETDPRYPTSAADIRKFHTDPPPTGRGWLDIAYTKYIRRDGTIEDGRGWDQVGGHTVGWNHNSVGFCLEGGLGAKRDGAFADHFTPAQAESLVALIRNAIDRYGPLDVYGHHDAPGVTKACPGFDAGAWWAAQQATP